MQNIVVSRKNLPSCQLDEIFSWLNFVFGGTFSFFFLVSFYDNKDILFYSYILICISITGRRNVFPIADSFFFFLS